MFLVKNIKNFGLHYLHCQPKIYSLMKSSNLIFKTSIWLHIFNNNYWILPQNLI